MAKQTNTLRIDPTRTTMLRRGFSTKLGAKFDSLKREINTLVIIEDVFGLAIPKPGRPNVNNTPNEESIRSREFSGGSPNPIENERRDEERNQPTTSFIFNGHTLSLNEQFTINARWVALSSQEKLRAFKEWLRLRLGDKVLSMTDEELWRRYVEEGYRKGMARSFDDTKKATRFLPNQADFYQGSRQQFLRDSFSSPVAIEKVKLLAARSFEDLKGVTSAMSTKMGRVLADGLVQGKGPREIARELNKAVDGIGKNRALMIARTELIRAHSEGQLDGLENLGITEVGVMVEWSAVSGDACPMCTPMDGVVLKISEARGMIPRHPNCRCAWIPANVGEKDKKQKRTKRMIERALTKSVKEETGERSVAAAFGDSTWEGADKTIASRRPTRNEEESLVRDLVSFIRIINSGKVTL